MPPLEWSLNDYGSWDLGENWRWAGTVYRTPAAKDYTAIFFGGNGKPSRTDFFACSFDAKIWIEGQYYASSA